jgi:hypothetical protein
MDALDEDEESDREQDGGLSCRGENLGPTVAPGAPRRGRSPRQRGRHERDGEAASIRQQMPGIDDEREAPGEDGARDFGKQDDHTDAQRDRQAGVSRLASAVVVCHVLRVRVGAAEIPGAPNSGRSRFDRAARNILSALRPVGGSPRQFPGEEMAGQAGWYRAPGEDGMLRYWNGAIWTDHRQQAPAGTSTSAKASTPVVPRDVVPPDTVTPDEGLHDLDLLAEYERQFAAQPEAVLAPERQPQLAGRSAFIGSDLTSAALPLAAPRGPIIPTPRRPQLAAPVAVVSAPTAPTPVSPSGATTSAPSEAAPSEQVTEAPDATLERQVAVESDTTATAETETEADTATAAEGSVGTDSHRTGVLRALIGLGAGILIVLLGLGLLAATSSMTAMASGDARGNGIVTSLGSTAHGSCTPIARFAVAGTSYTANSKTAISPCPVGLGQTVDVIYSVANPESAARVQMGSSFAQFAWLVPVLGGLLFLGSLFVFIVQAGSITGGIALIRDGGKRRTRVTDA